MLFLIDILNKESTLANYVHMIVNNVFVIPSLTIIFKCHTYTYYRVERTKFVLGIANFSICSNRAPLKVMACF